MVKKTTKNSPAELRALIAEARRKLREAERQELADLGQELVRWALDKKAPADLDQAAKIAWVREHIARPGAGQDSAPEPVPSVDADESVHDDSVGREVTPARAVPWSTEQPVSDLCRGSE